jgi:PAS domain S-box-containing protein
MTGDLEPVEYFENSVLTRTGNERIIAWHNTLLTDEKGNRIGTLSSGTDITQRTRAEEELKRAHAELDLRVKRRTAELTSANERLTREIEERGKAEEQLRAIYDSLVDGLLIANVATKRLVRANPSILRMLGYSEEELLSLSVMDIHPAEDLPSVLEKFRAQAERRRTVAENCPVLCKDGSVFYADITASHITYDGEPSLIGFFRDITERKQAQEALQREHRVLRGLLQSQDRERQLIAYDIHDGLAQQLAGAIMQFETLYQSSDRNTEQAAASCGAGVEMLRKTLSEARRLISGLRHPILEESGIVAAIRDMANETAARGGPHVDYWCRVMFDRLEPVLENTIYRVVEEGLNNALRHSQSDELRIELTQEGRLLRIRITDRGVGFDPSIVREGCFGLEGIRERARLLGGNASVKSAPGEGTRITVELPLAGGK